MSNRELENSIGLLQFKVFRIKKKYFKNIVMLRRVHPQAQTTWKKRFAIHLVKVGGLDTIVEATKKLKSALRVDVWVETMKNALKEAGLRSTNKVPRPTLFARN
jgi:hypothetical protein